jgi:hypothetical protein
MPEDVDLRMQSARAKANPELRRVEPEPLYGRRDMDGPMPVERWTRSRRVGSELSMSYGFAAGPWCSCASRMGMAQVEPFSPDARVDCRISADPAAFLLVGYGRINQWGPVARGKLLAWGRRPWKGFAFATYLRNP